MHQWTQRIIGWSILVQSLCGLVFCKHLSIVFIVASNIQLIMDCFVISIQGPPFVHVGYFIAVMSRMTISQYYFRDAFPFCDFYLHIVLWINNVQVGFVFNFLYTYEGKRFCILLIGLFGLSCFDFYIVNVYNFTFPFALSSYIWCSTTVFTKDYDVYKISNSHYLHTFQIVFSIQDCFAFCFLFFKICVVRFVDSCMKTGKGVWHYLECHLLHLLMAPFGEVDWGQPFVFHQILVVCLL